MSYRTGFYKGRLGIGLSTTMGMGDGKPRYPLDINGDIRLTGDIMNEEGLSLLGSTANGTFVLTDNNDISLTNNNYKVGIGTNEPKSKLDVVGSAVFKSVDSANTGGIVLMPDDEGTSTNGNSSGRIFFNETQNNINNYGFSIGFNGGADNDILNWKANTFNINRHDNSVDGSTVLTINRTSGNVGIGTTEPQGQLSLYQSGDNGGELWFGNSDINGSTSKNYGKISFNTYLGGGVPYRHIGHIRCIPYGSNYGGDIIFHTNNDIYGGNDRMVIRGNGNVGIGTTDPTNAELHIGNSGRIRFGTKEHLGDQRSGNGTGHVYNDTYGLYWSQCHADNAHSIGAKMIGINRLGTSAQYNITYVDLAFSLVNEYGGSSGSYDATSELMRLKATNDGGRVGIGTADPPVKFAVKEGGDAKMAIIAGQEHNDAILYFGTPYQGSVSNAMKAAIIAEGISNWSRSKLHFCLDNTGDNSTTYNASLSNSRMTITEAGNVGIGTTSPHASYKLDVQGHIRTMSGGIISTEQHAASPKAWTIVRYFQNGISNGGFCAIKDERNGANSPWGDGASFGIGEKRQANYYIGVQLRGYTCYANTSSLTNTNISDRRIKKDIEDVPDNYALQKVRDLPCRYYNYKHEPKNSEYKVVGFIAQEVKQHLPGCINEGEMPVCMPNICEFVNVTWEKIGVDERDPSKNVFKIKCDEFEEYSNLTHRFYFSNDGSKNDENVLIRESSKEEDNSFIITEIDEPYDYVYVYGASQSDFLTIKKDQIFALHHSAIQELDRKVTALENENAELKAELDNKINNKTLELNNEINNKTLELDNKTQELDNKTQELDNKINDKIQEIKNTEDILLDSNKYEKNNTENIIGNISFVNGYTIVNYKKIYNKNISDKLYFNPDTGKLNCSNIESTFYGDGSNLQGIVKQSQINDLIEENKKIKQENENNKELINFWTQQAMNLNSKLTNIENELKTIKENLGL